MDERYTRPDYSFVAVTLSALLAVGPTFAACVLDHSHTSKHASKDSVIVNGAGALVAAVRDVNRGIGSQILLDAGIYELDAPLVIKRDGITIRGRTGQRSDIIIKGAGPTEGSAHIFLVEASDFTLADLTVGWVRHHAVQVRGEMNADNAKFINVEFRDAGQQLLKVSYAGPEQPTGDYGLVEAFWFEYSPAAASHYYIGGVDVHGGKGWVVKDSRFVGITSPETRLAEHAIHFWSNASDTLVERNRISRSDRGIGFGLGERGHIGGIIRNNMIHTIRDVGIGLESSKDTLVTHNTVLTNDYPNAIEFRFKQTSDVSIRNNLTNAAIASRDGASGVLSNNVSSANLTWFRLSHPTDFTLTKAIPTVVDGASNTAAISDDIHCEPRPFGAGADVGADETQLSPDETLRSELPGKRQASLTSFITKTHYTLRQLVGHPYSASIAGAFCAAIMVLVAVAKRPRRKTDRSTRCKRKYARNINPSQ